MKNKRPAGVIIFGILLILTSLAQLAHIPTYAQYKFINQGLAEHILRIRFFISYLLRIVGLVSGVGILCLSSFFRKVALGLACFSILTMYWRHTYQAFLMYTTPIYDQFGITAFSLQAFTWISVIIRCVIDVAFAASLIYYLTRPGVIKQFGPG